ncbi:MAG TPA: response regulator [Actinophytocola sp.]|uniref:response regulator n=1 Tax=Actinophytocola sp. TaxID=1872138 RepID=UPI002DDCE83C|nr:response regulator [Actinophytocola sp.]HEV2778064.1 response regulator [Actinophytocola sp.]
MIVDDHSVVTAGVRYWCGQADPPIELIDANARLANVWTGPGANADVVIFDLQLQTDQQEFTELRRLVDSGRRVVVYSQDAHNTTAVRCVSLGALAYVTKREGQEHLVAAVRAAAAGSPYTPPSLSGALVADDDPNRPHLAPMEIAALRAWFASSSKQMAATMLGISARTVDTYIERVRVRYANAGRPAPTKSDLVARALEDGLITLADLNNHPI